MSKQNLRGIIWLSVIGGLVVLSLWLTGCANAPVSSGSSNNPQVPVDLLFTHDGCSVYRFSDEGYLHYYAVCGSQSVTMSQQVRSGKTSRPDSLPTEAR